MTPGADIRARPRSCIPWRCEGLALSESFSMARRLEGRYMPLAPASRRCLSFLHSRLLSFRRPPAVPGCFWLSALAGSSDGIFCLREVLTFGKPPTRHLAKIGVYFNEDEETL